MVGNDPVNTIDDIYNVNSNPAKDSGLCWRQGLVTFRAIFPHPPSSASFVHPSCAVCMFAKEVGGNSFLAQSSALLPSLPFPLCNPEELALYSEQEKAEGGRGSYEGCTPPRFYFLLEDCVRCRKQLGQ